MDGLLFSSLSIRNVCSISHMWDRFQAKKQGTKQCACKDIALSTRYHLLRRRLVFQRTYDNWFHPESVFLDRRYSQFFSFMRKTIADYCDRSGQSLPFLSGQARKIYLKQVKSTYYRYFDRFLLKEIIQTNRTALEQNHRIDGFW